MELNQQKEERISSSEMLTRFLSSPIPVVLVSLFAFVLQVRLLFELDALSLFSAFRALLYSTAIGTIFLSAIRFRWCTWILTGILLFVEITAVIIIYYVRYFNVTPTISSLSLLAQTSDAAPSFKEMINGDVISLFAGIILSALLVLLKHKASFYLKRRKLLLSVTISLCITSMLLIAYKTCYRHFSLKRVISVKTMTPRDAIELYGYLPYIIAHYFALEINTNYTHHLPNPLPPRTCTRGNGSKQIKPPYNFIIIQVESLDNTLINRKTADGLEIIPVLNKLAKEHIYCPNFYAQHGSGGSSDAEIAAISGILPLQDCPVMLTHPVEQLPSLAKDLKKYGYKCYGMHGNRSSFWNRGSVYGQFGFDKFYDAKNYSKWASGWRSLDGEFFKESVKYVKEIASAKEPFLLYMITLSMHAPYAITILNKDTEKIHAKDYRNEFYFQRAKNILM